MKQFANEVEVNASAEHVWHLLTDFANFPQWNPFLQRVSGTPTKGGQLEVMIGADGVQSRISHPTVTAVDPNRELRWREQSRIPGLLRVEHSFTIETLETGCVRFTQRGVFTGLLVSLGAYRRADTRLGFRAMNQALKLRAEQAHAAS